MASTQEDQATLEALEAQLRTILPEEYQDTYDQVEPVSMGSAGLKFRRDGKVAWDEIWSSFCDLALAGGPPHKGKLLQPGTITDIQSQPDRHQAVVDEIIRGIRMITGLETEPSPIPGWVRVTCDSRGMAGWLVRAIAMENVSVRQDGESIDVPAGPDYRLEKEIKNVITVIAKTCHYFTDHMWSTQQREIEELFARTEAVSPLVQPAIATQTAVDSAALATAIQRETGFTRAPLDYDGWLGLACPSVKSAIWMMRTLVLHNVLARREETVLFVPINPVTDPHGELVLRAVARTYRLASATGRLAPNSQSSATPDNTAAV